MSISTEESISIIIEFYKRCCQNEIVHFKQEIANGNGEWLIDYCLNDYKIKSEDINLKLYQSGRIIWLLSYLLNNHLTVLIDYFLSKIDKEKDRKGVNATYSLENLFSFLLKSGNFKIDELEELLDKKTREDIVYGYRGSTEYLRYTIEKLKKELDKSSPKPEIKLLKSLIKEFKDNQKFETIKSTEPSGTKNDADKKKTTKPENPYPRIFVNYEAYSIFTELQKNLVRARYKLADYSFVYRQMLKDKFIYEGIKEKEFRDWLEQSEFEIKLDDPLKTLTECSTDWKNRIYSTIAYK